ncbi:MAG: nucleotidyltransferase [bacterium]|nr:nucleotidyltransferase [bacterium]
MTKSKYLNKTLESYKMNNIADHMEKYKEKRKFIKEKIEEMFSDKIASNPINSGSYAKHTSINISFDLDIFIPFKRGSFSTLKEMHTELYNYFFGEYKLIDKELVNVKYQRTSIGLIFSVDNHELDIDIVPGREINEDEYNDTFFTNLYDSSQEKRSIQTNVKGHIDLILGQNKERSIIRLLKVWKISNDIKLKSFLIELFTLKAFEKKSITGNLWNQLSIVCTYIKDNIETINLKDPYNDSNVLTDTLSQFDKKVISSKIQNMLDQVELYPEQLKIYFPCNPDYYTPEEESSDENLNEDTGYTFSGSKPSVLDTRSYG